MKRTAFRLALVLLVFTGAAAAAVSATAAASGTAKWTTTLVGGDPFALDCPTTTFCLAVQHGRDRRSGHLQRPPLVEPECDLQVRR